MRLTIIASVSLLALLVGGGVAHAQTDAAGPIDCAGGDAVINGDNRNVTIHGACRSLSVHGNANQVQAELAPRAQVDVQGDGNHIRYRLVGGTEDARVAVQGQQDVVGPDAAPVAGEAAPATQQPLLLDAGTAPEGNCTDRDVTISSSDTSYTLHGGCRSVTVTGSRTTVHAEMQPQSRISIPGPDDRVFWFLKGSGAPPTTDVTGANSQTSQQAALGSVIAPPSAGPIGTGDQPPLVLAGGTGVVQDQCAGRDVQINGDNTTFVLRDRCRTIEVNGSGDKIEAELLAGSRVKIVGDNSIVQFVLMGTGADPIVSVSGDQSKAYRIQRLGATNRADASRGATPTAAGMRVQGGAGASVVEMNPVPQPTGK
jgi:acid stress-induced BolA-like protein IbaG/YrbA